MTGTKRFVVVYDVDGDVCVDVADLTFDQQQALSEHFAISHVMPLENLTESDPVPYEELFDLSEDL